MSQSPSLLDLPNELLLSLAGYIPTGRDVNALVRTNRRLYDLLNGHLYRRDLNANRALRWAAMRNQERTALLALSEGGADIDTNGLNDNFTVVVNMHELLGWRRHRTGRFQQPRGDLRPLTPLQIAVYFKWEGLARMLVEHGADVRKRWPVVGVAPIHIASYLGLTETVQVLLDKDKGLLEYRDAASQTPLYHAVSGGDLGTVKYLLERGADRDVRDKSIRKPVDVAKDQAIRMLLSTDEKANSHNKAKSQNRDVPSSAPDRQIRKRNDDEISL